MTNHYKRLFTLLVFSILSFNLKAQYGPQIENRGFEQWTNRVSEPTHWHSGGTATGSFSGFVSSQIEQSTHSRPGSTGSKSVRLYPTSILGITANGNLTNGRMNAGSMSATGSGNYNYTQRSQSAYNSPISQVPDSLSIWVCFRSQSASDKAQVKAVVHGDTDYRLVADGTEDPANMHVATAALSFTRTSSAGGAYTWRRLSIPFNNNGPCTDVRYILMTATTNETPGSGSTNDDLFVDDLLLVYNPTLTMSQLSATQFNVGSSITIPFTLTGTMSPDNLNASANQVIAQLSDANGNFNNPTELGRTTTNASGNITAQIPNVQAGNGYRVRVVSTNYPLVGGNIQTITILPNTYNIIATADPNNGGTVSGAGEYNQGASCTLTATANTGYTFVNWTKNGTQVSTNASYTFTVTESGSYVAHFQINSYDITATADPTNGGTVSGAGQFNHGDSCTLTATANTGYTFVNWTKNGTQVSTNPSYTFTVTESGSYVAHFQINSYDIAASADPSNAGTVSGAGQFNHGTSCTLTATANEGYSFVNWTKNGTQVSTNANYTFTVTESGSYVAHFQINSYDIAATADPSNGGTVSGAGQFNHGASCTLTATANEGYTFVNWTKNGTQVSTNATYTFTVTESANYVAHFNINSYTVELSANPSNSGTTLGEGTYSHGQSCTVIATSADGYTFTNWTENGNVVSSDANYSFTVTSNRSLVANFEEQLADTYNINVSPNPIIGGTVTGGGNYNAEQQCTVTATANEGYTFVNWTENGEEVATNASYTFIVAGNRTLVANFTLNSYMIGATADPTEGGSINGAGEYEYGQTCTLTATPNENYIFVNWTKDDEPISNDTILTFTVTGDASYVAHFEYYDRVNKAMANCTIYPNPFVSKVIIEAEKEIKAICVYDIFGRLVKQTDANGSRFGIDLSELNDGTYLLRVDFEGSSSAHRIVKTRQ